MNRIDRLFGILLLLQARRKIRAQDMAEQFEVSERTIYRDMSALMQMGVPIVSTPHEGYEILAGYYLPPLLFTETEATALLLGFRMLIASGNVAPVATQGGEKIAAALPDNLRHRVLRQAGIIDFFMQPGQINLFDPLLIDLQNAILDRRLTAITYHSLRDNTQTNRHIEPEKLTFSGKAWYVSAYCRLRQDMRSFRLDRIESLQLLQDTFEPRSLPPQSPSESIRVVVRFAPQVMRWVQERQHYGFLEASDTTMIYQVDHLDEIRSWLMGWGSHAEVLAPDTLRTAIREDAKKLWEILT